MSRIFDVLWIVVRVAAFWAAVYGYGRLAGKLTGRFKAPVLFLGLISLLVLSVPLSLAGLFNRTVLTILLCSGTIPALLHLTPKLRYRKLRRLPGLTLCVIGGITLFFVTTNLLRASEPHSNPDALVTYAVQPDRWLEEGRIYYIEECIFSGFPMTGEILASWQASLAASRTDTLSLLQVFQMSMLLAAAGTAWRILGKGRKGLLICISACMATSMLAGWASLPKIEMTVLYFSTVALASILRNLSERNLNFDPVPFLAMGLALSTKYTAYVLLPSFILGALALRINRSRRIILPAMLLLLLPPAVFAVRTAMHTGAPFYPKGPSFLPADSAHMLGHAPEVLRLKEANTAPLDLLVNTSPDGFFTNVSALFSSWGLPGLIFLLGIAGLLKKRRLGDAAVPIAVILLYAFIAVFAFNPIRWGAKYAFLVLPLLAALGTRWSKDLTSPRLTMYAAAVLLLVTSSIIPRAKYLLDFPNKSDSLDFRYPDLVAVRPLHEWCNANLPEGTRLLSMWKRERYFSDHTVIVAENHPVSRILFFENSLEREIELLKDLSVDYVYCSTDDPLPGNLEESVPFLSEQSLLEPVIEVSGFSLFRIVHDDI
jgi:hypothetical protein